MELLRIMVWFWCRGVEFEIVVEFAVVRGIVGRVRVVGEVVLPASRGCTDLGQVTLDILVTEHPHESPVPWWANDTTSAILDESSSSRGSGGGSGGEEGALGVVVSLDTV